MKKRNNFLVNNVIHTDQRFVDLNNAHKAVSLPDFIYAPNLPWSASQGRFIYFRLFKYNKYTDTHDRIVDWQKEMNAIVRKYLLAYC